VWQPLRITAESGAPGAVQGTRVMSARSAALVLDMLSDANARAPGFGDATPFDFPFRAAVKTGTSRHFTDNWAVGVTAGFTVAVWVGNFNGHPMEGVSGVAGAGPLLAHAMLLAANRMPAGDLVRPEAVGAMAVDICAVSGMLAGPACPRITEWFAPGSVPRAECDWHHDGVLTLPALYAEWAAQAAQASGERPAAAVQRAAAIEPRGFRIVSPKNGDRFSIPPGVPSRYATVALLTAGAPAGEPVAWYVDGRATANARLTLQPGSHVIRAVAGGSARGAAGPHDEVRVEVE
jgi:penicillin-binding protein 1C